MDGRIQIKNKLYPSDYEGEYGSLAIKLPMNNFGNRQQAQVFNTSVSTEEQTISNFINLLLTRPGERFMQPNFGVGLYFYVFEQNVDSLRTILEDRIREQASYWLPYVIINYIRVSTYNNKLGDENSVNIEISFKVLETGANRVVTLYTEAERNFNIEVV